MLNETQAQLQQQDLFALPDVIVPGDSPGTDSNKLLISKFSFIWFCCVVISSHS